MINQADEQDRRGTLRVHLDEHHRYGRMDRLLRCFQRLRIEEGARCRRLWCRWVSLLLSLFFCNTKLMAVPSDPSLFRLPRTLSDVRLSSVSPVVRRSVTGSSPSVQTNVLITRYVPPPSSTFMLTNRAETSRPIYEKQSPTTPMSTLTMSVERLLISCFPSPSDTERLRVAVPSPVCSHHQVDT